MTSIDHKSPLSFFIIGPMLPTDDGAKLTYADHIPNIRNALERVCERVLGDKRGYDIDDPQERVGAIRNRVFTRIDTADIAVADIAGARPAVFYELAVLHSLGVPVITLDLDRKDYTAPFYLNNTTIVRLENYRVETIEAPLEERLRQLIETPQVSDSLNPISEFYDNTALVNVAASAGLATGQMYNFIRWVIRPSGIFRHSRGAFEELVVIRPTSFSDVYEVAQKLEETFGEVQMKDGKEVRDANGQPIRKLPSKFWKEEDHPRGGYWFSYVGRQIVDYPTPISSLQISPRYKKKLDIFDDESLEPGVKAPAISAAEQQMIGIYFNTLRRLANRREFDVNGEKMHFMSVEDFIAQAKPASS